MVSCWYRTMILMHHLEYCWWCTMVLHGAVDKWSWRSNLCQSCYVLRTRAKLVLLRRNATEEESEMLVSGHQRLVGEGEGGMGRTYQVMAIASPSLGSLAGFDANAHRYPSPVRP